MPKKNKQQHTVNTVGDSRCTLDRDFGLYRPCSCGCDQSDGAKGVGYLNGIKQGLGVTVWIESEEVYQALKLFVNEF